jgi:ubiquinone/menaquinone biosynthesis C-methylase UbiE
MSSRRILTEENRQRDFASCKEEHRFWENVEKNGDMLDLRYARDLPDDTPGFILSHLTAFEQDVSKFCFENASGDLLDAGCGNANLLVHALKKHPIMRLNYTGMDFSKMMLARAERRLRDEHHPGSFRFLQGCVDDLPFVDAAFDRVVCSGVLTCLSSVREAEESLNEFYRVLRPGGELFVDFFNSSSHFTRARRICGEPINPPEYVSPDQFLLLLENAGFEALAWRGFDFKPFQGYLFMSRLKALDPLFIQERLSRRIESSLAARSSRISKLGYRVYVKCIKK